MNDGSRVMVAVTVAATPERAFAAFTEQISHWWRHNGLFTFSDGRTGTLTFEPGPTGRLTETYTDGEVFEIGRITVWDPPRGLALTWREASFDDDQETELRVHFDVAGERTRVTVEHYGWDTIPQEHAARHGFPLATFQLRFAQWWQQMLSTMPV